MVHDPISPAVILVTVRKKSLPKLKTQGSGKTRDKILVFLDSSSPRPHLLLQRKLHQSHSSSSLLKPKGAVETPLRIAAGHDKTERSDFSSTSKAPTFFLH